VNPASDATGVKTGSAVAVVGADHDSRPAIRATGSPATIIFRTWNLFAEIHLLGNKPTSSDVCFIGVLPPLDWFKDALIGAVFGGH